MNAGLGKGMRYDEWMGGDTEGRREIEKNKKYTKREKEEVKDR